MLLLNVLVVLMAVWILCNHIKGTEFVKKLCAFLIALALLLLLLDMFGVLSVGNPHL